MEMTSHNEESNEPSTNAAPAATFRQQPEDSFGKTTL